jgi:hypothetical protein
MGTNISGTLHEDKSSTNIIDSDMYGNNAERNPYSVPMTVCSVFISCFVANTFQVN